MITNAISKAAAALETTTPTLIMMASQPILMEKSNQQSLNCPRCDSSNTKFCYYNNYSLSQPRHFCKACKRYWTRGGTIRNVPVGGSCRKNKRLKKPPSSSISAPDSLNSTSNPNNHPSSSNPDPPLFYGVPTTTDHVDHLNLPYPNFNSRVSFSGLDGILGFSSGLIDYSCPNQFNPKDIHQLVNSNSLLSRFPIFTSSDLDQQQQHKFMGLLPYEEDMQLTGNSDGNMAFKELEMEDNPNRLNWDSATPMDHIVSSDPSILWSSPGVGSWLDPSNIGPSALSLI